MKRDHEGFFFELSGKLGPPTFAATMVACLLAGKLEPSHFVLMGLGVVLIGISHWHTYHKES